eukprot:374350-Pelagomonas_calceolata.AAC.1
MQSKIKDPLAFKLHAPYLIAITWIALSTKKERKIYTCRSAACIKEGASHWLPPIEGIFISTPAIRIRSGDLLLAVALSTSYLAANAPSCVA